MDEADPLVRWILGRAKIKNKLVVLCEGDRPPLNEGKPLSPQAYGRLERLPDANFYLACVPRNWHGDRLPVFFNCGDRAQVLSSFTALLAAHAQDPSVSRLNPQKLYALVDLDVQCAKLPQGYPWATTEAVHEALYDDGSLKAQIDDRHRIWVTALVHKEAFFVLPGAASNWIGGAGAFFRGQPIDLNAFYRTIAQALATDHDVHLNLPLVQARLARFRQGAPLSCASSQALCTSWLGAYVAANAAQQESLVRTLVSVAKVKPFWKEIDGGNRAIPAEGFRDQLTLDVARHISSLAANDHPLAGFFDWLKPQR
jgi:hypothetical protein